MVFASTSYIYLKPYTYSSRGELVEVHLVNWCSSCRELVDQKRGTSSRGELLGLFGSRLRLFAFAYNVPEPLHKCLPAGSRIAQVDLWPVDDVKH